MKGLYFNIPEFNASTKTYGYVENACIQIYSILTADSEKVLHKYFYIGDVDPINISKWANLIRMKLNKSKPITLPILFLKIGSIIGDFLLNNFNINKFPLNSVRYKNMTNNNIIKVVNDTNELVLDKNSLVNLDDSIERTLTWIVNNK